MFPSPQKHLGQNFLIDRRVARRIIEACALDREDVVLEIGPGRGALTGMIAERVKRVIAIEKDRALAQALYEEFKDTNTTVIEADILQFPLEQLPPSLKVIGNLPYNIATAIIQKFLKCHRRFRVFYMGVQREHADRMTAAVHSKIYGAFSLFVQYYSEVKKLFPIKNTAFYPVPKVQSFFVKMRPHPKPLLSVVDEKALFDLIHAAFSQRRKMIVNTLSQVFIKEDLKKLCEGIHLNPQARAEDVTLAEYIQLTQYLKESKSSHSSL